MTWNVEQLYFEWLTEHVNFGYGKPNGRTFADLMSQLHTKEFVWIVPNDDNRLEDAIALRHEFLHDAGISNHSSGFALGSEPPLSVLEVIVGLSRRCSFADSGEPRNWAWKLIENIDLHKMSDPVSRRKTEVIDDILEKLIWRNYEPDGEGGFFPLTHPDVNQKEVEIWYQMNAYLEEGHEH